RPSRTICCTRASMSALVPSTLNLGAVSAGRRATSGGKSHSWLRPTSQSLRPSALTISVALAIKLTTRRRGWDGTIGSVVVMYAIEYIRLRSNRTWERAYFVLSHINRLSPGAVRECHILPRPGALVEVDLVVAETRHPPADVIAHGRPLPPSPLNSPGERRRHKAPSQSFPLLS